MEQIIALCNDAIRYPRNLTHGYTLDYILASYWELLNEHHHRLFSAEDKAALNFWDLDNEGKGRLISIGALYQPWLVYDQANVQAQPFGKYL